MATMLVRIEEFTVGSQSWKQYYERFVNWAEVNAVESSKIVRVFLAVIGPSAYNLLKTLTRGADLSKMTLEEFNDLLTDHLDPAPMVVSERYNFYSSRQQVGETIMEFSTRLQSLSSNCDFKDFTDQALRDAFVLGLSDTKQNIRPVLLAERDLTFKRAVELAQQITKATDDARRIQTGDHSVFKVKRSETKASDKSIVCYCCGESGHTRRACPKRDQACTFCGIRGHVESVCRKRASSNKHVISNVNFVSEYFEPFMIDVEIESTKFSIEVDTGSPITILKSTDFRKLGSILTPCTTEFVSYTGHRVKLLGMCSVAVALNGRCFRANLYVSESGSSIVGRDWLKQSHVWDSSFQVKSLEVSKEQIFQEYKELFSRELGCIRSHVASVTLKKDAKPIFCRARPLSHYKRDLVEIELRRMEKLGVIEKVNFSEWAFPIVTPLKKDGEIRVCGDFSAGLNKSIEVDVYPLPRPEELFSRLTGGQLFSVLDVSSAYLQLPVSEESARLLTINTHKGLYRFKRMPFGLASAPAIWQRVIEEILGDIPMVSVYIDDIIVTGKNRDDHIKSLRLVFDRLLKHGIKLKPEKCKLFSESVEYCGLVVSKDGLSISKSKVKALVEMPHPSSLADIRCFCGLANYYRNYLPNLSETLSPLYELLKKESKLVWGPVEESAFNHIKEQITNSLVLSHFDPGLEISLSTDASSHGLGAVLSHILPDGSERPIAFASRLLSKAERNYSTIEKEGLGIIWAIKKFLHYLEGRHFMLCTDHMPLVSLFGGRKGVPLTASARIYRWAIFLSGFTFTVKHKKGIDNAPADAFSRLPIKDEAVGKVSSVDRAIVKHLENLIDPNSILSLDYETENDEILRQVREMHLRNWRFYKKSPELDPYYKLRDELSLMGKLIIMREKIVVPVAARSYLLKRLHEGHLGFTKTKSLARQCIWWPSIDEDIMRLIENCPICSLHKRKQPPQVSIKPWVKMTSPLERVYIDFVGPLANKMIFVLVDDFSKWPEAMVMDTTTAEDTIQVLDEIFSRIGVPREIVSDNGPQFISKTFSDYLQGEGIIHTRSPPYHPSTNGTAERFVQTLKGSIGNCRGDKLRWQVSKFLKSYRNSEHCTTKRSPAELLIGRKIRTLFDNLKPATQLTRNESFTCRSLNIGDTVLVRFYRSTGGKWEQGTVTDILGDRNYIVYVNGQYHHRHIDQLIKQRFKEGKIYNQVTRPFALLEPHVEGTSINDTNESLSGSQTSMVHGSSETSYKKSTTTTPLSSQYTSEEESFDI
ncbi:Transposon Tf2-9 polyprotein [Thelohanellus kitauei]|uniref:Transposon Tf2-9 polyprotein n=1 Tax=Thelohanellus kitauei TaxID=669202 RepID=A0A0C2MSE0_THEKT|nr:Transposon Tf2-9 polyprotein [Thelohanellus kitauei]